MMNSRGNNKPSACLPGSKAQSSFNFLTRLASDLRACIILKCQETKITAYWTMQVHLYYENAHAGVTSFRLRGYTRNEAIELVRNIRNNPYLMREIDDFLLALNG